MTLELWADPANDGERSCCSPQAVHGRARPGPPHGPPARHARPARARSAGEVVDDFVAELRRRAARPTRACAATAWCASTRCSSWPTGSARPVSPPGTTRASTHDGDGPLLRAAADPRRTRPTCWPGSSADELARLWFPLGELSKPARARAGARRRAVRWPRSRESQDLCFLAGTRRCRLPDPPRRRSRARRAGRDRGPRAAACSGSHRRPAGLHGRASAAASAWPAPEPLYVLRQGRRARPPCVVGPRGSWRPRTVALERRHAAAPGQRGGPREAALPLRADRLQRGGRSSRGRSRAARAFARAAGGRRRARADAPA